MFVFKQGLQFFSKKTFYMHIAIVIYVLIKQTAVVVLWKLDLQLPMQSVPITTKVDGQGVLNTTLCDKVSR